MMKDFADTAPKYSPLHLRLREAFDEYKMKPQGATHLVCISRFNTITFSTGSDACETQIIHSSDPEIKPYIFIAVNENRLQSRQDLLNALEQEERDLFSNQAGRAGRKLKIISIIDLSGEFSALPNTPLEALNNLKKLHMAEGMKLHDVYRAQREGRTVSGFNI